MGRKSGSSVLKRQRELKKAEKAAQKKERRLESGDETEPSNQVASADDLAGYGFPVGEDADEDARD